MVIKLIKKGEEWIRKLFINTIKYNFKSASRPLGEAPQATQLPAPAEDFTQGVVSEITQDKLDYIIGLAEAIAEAVGANAAQPSTEAPGSPDLDDLDI